MCTLDCKTEPFLIGTDGEQMPDRKESEKPHNSCVCCIYMLITSGDTDTQPEYERKRLYNEILVLLW